MNRFPASTIALLLQACLLASVIAYSLSFHPLQAQEPQLPTTADPVLRKITFDISVVTPEGLVGSLQGLRSIAYEFCIPADEQYLAEVLTIDPSITYHPHSRGRIGCHTEQYLCLGGSSNSRWRDILLAIARLEYVDQIDEFLGE